VGVLRTGDGTVAANDTSKAELLNNYLGSVCTKDDGSLPAFDKLVPENVAFSNVTFTPENVERVMRKLKKCFLWTIWIPYHSVYKTSSLHSRTAINTF